MVIKEYPILGFQPDLPANTPGVITVSAGIVPTDRGIGNGGGSNVISTSFTGGNSGAELFKIDGTSRPFVGTTAKLYELAGGTTTTDRSGAVYNGAAGWTFAQMGDISLAANKGDALQQIGAGATFAAVATAPKATIVITPGLPNAQFAMLFDYNDGVNNYTDGVFWSGLGDYTNWTPSIASQCGNVRLTDVNGAFTAAIPFRDGVIAFKAHAMYWGQYVGGSTMWAWTRISNQVGCLNANAVCEVDDVLYFADSSAIWRFDGSYPRKTPGAIHKWWASNNVASDVKLTWDRAHHRLWVAYSDNLNVKYYLAFNPISGLWTQYGLAANSPNFMLSANYAYNGSFLSLNQIPSLSPSITLGAHGAPYGITTLKSIRPEWLVGNPDSDTTWVTATVNHGPSLRNLSASGAVSATTAVPGRFDVVVSDRYVQPVITVTAVAWELQKIAVDLESGGAE